MVKAAAIVQTAEQRTVCVCLFADKKTSFHTIDVTVIYSLVHVSQVHLAKHTTITKLTHLTSIEKFFISSYSMAVFLC